MLIDVNLGGFSKSGTNIRSKTPFVQIFFRLFYFLLHFLHFWGVFSAYFWFANAKVLKKVSLRKDTTKK